MYTNTSSHGGDLDQRTGSPMPCCTVEAKVEGVWAAHILILKVLLMLANAPHWRAFCWTTRRAGRGLSRIHTCVCKDTEAYGGAYPYFTVVVLHLTRHDGSTTAPSLSKDLQVSPSARRG
jgi:hypothetical protein